MKTIEDYFTYVRQLMQRVPDTSAERYEEQRLSVHRGNLRIRLRFSNHALLETVKPSSSLLKSCGGSATAIIIKTQP